MAVDSALRFRIEALLTWTSRGTVSRFRNEPADKSSRTAISFRAPRCSTRWEPMNPAPPVTRTRVPCMGSRRTEGDGHKGSGARRASSHGEMCELRADVEQSARDIRVSGGPRRLPDVFVCEVLARDSFDLGRNREVDRCLGSFLRALEEHPHEPHNRGGAAHPEIRPDHAGMAGVHGDPGPLEASRELPREEDLRELRLTVRAEAAVSLLTLKLVEMNGATRVCARGDVDDARRRGLLQEVEEEVCQQKPGEVVDLERPLESVRRDLAVRRVHPGVIDENFEPRILPLEFLCERPCRVFTRQIDDLEVDL